VFVGITHFIRPKFPIHGSGRDATAFPMEFIFLRFWAGEHPNILRKYGNFNPKDFKEIQHFVVFGLFGFGLFGDGLAERYYF
jgi:peptidoglycan biosynthesis protein MviN/MurJ (putative lipid II flippase)